MVLIPGGGSKAVDFDIPGFSFLEKLTTNGFSAVALNRPGQGDSPILPIDPANDHLALSANAEILLDSIDEIWSSFATYYDQAHFAREFKKLSGLRAKYFEPLCFI